MVILLLTIYLQGFRDHHGKESSNHPPVLPVMAITAVIIYQLTDGQGVWMWEISDISCKG